MEIAYRSGSPEPLWKPTLYKLYLFYGEEDRLKDEGVNALLTHAVVPDFADFDFEAMDASNVTADDILAASAQAPFASERRVVLVRGMEQWRDRNKQSEADRLAQGLERLSDSVCLVLYVASEDEEAKRKTAVTTKLDNAAKKHGALVTCKALKGDGLNDWIYGRVRREGKKIEADATAHLVASVGPELLSLEQELLKLVCYVGERATINAWDVAIVTSTGPEDVMFVTIDAIVRRQTDRALCLLGELQRYDPKPQAVAGKLLALLSRQYRMLWQAKYLQEMRISPRDVRELPPHIAAELPSESNIAQLAFKAADLFAQSRNYSWNDLADALERLLICDMANKGGVTDESGVYGGDVSVNLQMLILELTGATQKARKSA